LNVKTKLVPYFPWILLVFHTVGIFLFMRDPGNVILTPLNLMLCGFLVFLSEEKPITSLAYVVIFILGFCIELIGIKTGILFGNYYYTTVLSEKFLGVPVIIGVNWFVIIVSSASLFIALKIPLILKALLAGLAATAMDALIEPVAINYQFWIWENDTVPFYNYVCWFIFGTAFAYLYLKLATKRNATAFFLYFIWIVFFVTLNLM
jgi:bisanhydrobacterioruberin hydratase